MKYVNYYFLFVQINVVYTYRYCLLTNKDINININASRMGCHISDVCINHVFYADNLCLMAPCAIALQDYLIFVIAIVLKLI